MPKVTTSAALPPAMERIAALAAFGQAILDALKESGLLKAKRRARRSAAPADERSTRRTRTRARRPETAARRFINGEDSAGTATDNLVA